MSHFGETISFKQITETKLGKAYKKHKNESGFKKIGLAEKTRLIKRDMAVLNNLLTAQIEAQQSEITRAITQNDFNGLNQAINTVARLSYAQLPQHLVRDVNAFNSLVASQVAVRFIMEIEKGAVNLSKLEDEMAVHLALLTTASLSL